MLAEKFILVLEALLKSSQYPDGGARAKSPPPHVPVEPPAKKYAEAASVGDLFARRDFHKASAALLQRPKAGLRHQRGDDGTRAGMVATPSLRQ